MFGGRGIVYVYELTNILSSKKKKFKLRKIVIKRAKNEIKKNE